MKIDITFEQALERHPKAVEQVIKKLRSGKSKHKDDDPSTLNWHYSYGIAVQGYSFAEVLAGKPQEDQSKEPDTAEGIVEDQLNRVAGLVLTADKGRWWAGGVQLGDYRPPEMKEQFLKHAQEQLDEKNRVNQLTDEEREAELQECLAELSKSSGFMAISIPKNNT